MLEKNYIGTMNREAFVVGAYEDWGFASRLHQRCNPDLPMWRESREAGEQLGEKGGSSGTAYSLCLHPSSHSSVTLPEWFGPAFAISMQIQIWCHAFHFLFDWQGRWCDPRLLVTVPELRSYRLYLVLVQMSWIGYDLIITFFFW